MWYIDLIKDIVVPSVAAFTFVKVVIEYRRNQLWKESEFLSKEAKEFMDDEKVKLVFTLLDWNSRMIEVGGQKFKVDDKFMIESLKTHNVKPKFTQHEAIIRDLFDNFFDKLSQFNIHCKNGLFSEKKVFNYFEYYFDILISDGRKPKEFRLTIDKYLDYYGYDNVKSLLEKYEKTKKRP